MVYGTIYTGASFNIQHYIESSYGSGTSAPYASLGNLGAGESVTTFNIQNQYEPVYNLGSREIATYYSKGWQVGITVEFFMCNDNTNWLNYVMQGNLNPATSYSVGNIKSDCLTIGTGEGKVYVISGIVYTDASIKITEGDVIKITLSGNGRAMFSYPGSVTTTIPTQVLTYKDYVGMNGIIKEFDIDIKNEPEQYYGLGSLEYLSYLPTKFSVEGSFEVYHNSTTSVMPSVLPATSTSSANIQTFPTATVGNYIFTFSEVVYNEGEMNPEPVTVVTDKITYIAGNLAIAV